MDDTPSDYDEPTFDEVLDALPQRARNQVLQRLGRRVEPEPEPEPLPPVEFPVYPVRRFYKGEGLDGSESNTYDGQIAQPTSRPERDKEKE